MSPCGGFARFEYGPRWRRFVSPREPSRRFVVDEHGVVVQEAEVRPRGLEGGKVPSGGDADVACEWNVVSAT